MRHITRCVVLAALSVSCASTGSYEPELLPDEVFDESADCLVREATKYVDSDIDSTLLAETIGLACSEGLQQVIFADYPDADEEFVNHRLTIFGAAALSEARNRAKADAPTPANRQ